jgi:hypothetical protein
MVSFQKTTKTRAVTFYTGSLHKMKRNGSVEHGPTGLNWDRLVLQ